MFSDDDNVFDLELYSGGEYFATADDLYAKDNVANPNVSVRDRIAQFHPNKTVRSAPPPRESAAEHDLKPIHDLRPLPPQQPHALKPTNNLSVAQQVAQQTATVRDAENQRVERQIREHESEDRRRNEREREERTERESRERTEREIRKPTYVSPYIVQQPIVHHYTNEYNPIVYRRLYDYGVNYIPLYYSYDQRRRAEYLLENLIKKELLAKASEEELQKIIKSTLANTDTNGKIVEKSSTVRKTSRKTPQKKSKKSKKVSKKKSKKVSKKKSKKVSKKKSKKVSKKKK